MRTISVKVELREKIQFLNALQQAGLSLGEAALQHDKVFENKDGGEPRVIIRSETGPDGKQTHKLISRQFFASKGSTDSYITLIADYEQAAQIIRSLGYKLVAEVDKQRQTVDITDSITLYFDKVAKLGEYIKLERSVAKGDDLKWVQADLAETLKTLDISENAKLVGPYSSMAGQK